MSAHVRACSVLVSGATLYTRFARLLGNGSRIWLAVGELVLRMAVRCAPQEEVDEKEEGTAIEKTDEQK